MSSAASKPDFCGNYDCPSFTLESKTDEYEVRRYEGGKWVTTAEDKGLCEQQTSKNMLRNM